MMIVVSDPIQMVDSRGRCCVPRGLDHSSRGSIQSSMIMGFLMFWRLGLLGFGWCFGSCVVLVIGRSRWVLVWVVVCLGAS